MSSSFIRHADRHSVQRGVRTWLQQLNGRRSALCNRLWTRMHLTEHLSCLLPCLAGIYAHYGSPSLNPSVVQQHPPCNLTAETRQVGLRLPIHCVKACRSFQRLFTGPQVVGSASTHLTVEQVSTYQGERVLSRMSNAAPRPSHMPQHRPEIGLILVLYNCKLFHSSYRCKDWMHLCRYWRSSCR